MPKSSDGRTKQVNIRIEPEFEDLLKHAVDQIRRGGPTFRAALEALIKDHKGARYMTRSDLETRFDALERKILELESALARKR